MKHARNMVETNLGHVDGLIDMRLGVHTEGRVSIALGLSIWRDIEAARAFLGENWERPALWDPRDEWSTNATIEHYEQIAGAGAAGTRHGGR